VTGYLPVLIYLILIVAFGVVSLGMAWVLRPSRPFASAAKLDNYECGAEPIGRAWVQFPVGFYLVALVFIIFDALAVFLFPWAVSLRGLGLWGVGAMVMFIGTLSLGWLYAYREGILEWK
jgi:NADH-quinone oxidoreductase subunit A